VRGFFLLAALFLPSIAAAGSCGGDAPKDPAALAAREHAWAEALARHDADALGCILALEFQDADPDGKLHSRAETLAAVDQRKPGSNQLSELDPHVYGDAGYIRGLATLVDPEGKVTARVRFTDIYVYRDRRWQCVAGQESLVK